MLRNYFKIALRNLFKHRAYSFINILGLAIGITCCILVILFINYEFGYDRYHEKSERIYRIAAEFNREGNLVGYAGSPGPLAEPLRNEFPEIEKTVRIFDSFNARALVSHAEKRFYEPLFFYADRDFFEVFSFTFLRGNPAQALPTPNSVVITESMARKYFGDADPLNQILTLGNKYDFKVTGVIEDVPDQSHFRFDFLAAFESLDQIYYENFYTGWGAWNFYTYLLLSPGADAEVLEQQLPAFVDKYFGPESSTERLFLQPLADIHLHSHLRNEMTENGNLNNIYFFSVIALIILLLAGINFVNFTTARSALRSREVGLRKVVGAKRPQLIKQFLGESLLLAVLAFPVSLMLAEMALPVFNKLVNRQVSLSVSANGEMLVAFLGIVLLTGFLGGIYPAFFLSSFRPLSMLKQAVHSSSSGGKFRSLLVVIQFSASIVLLVSTVVVFEQMNFIRSKDLGMDKDHIVFIPLKGEVRKNFETIETELARNSDVLGVSATSFTPTGEIWHEGFSWDNDEKYMSIDRISVDANFLSTFHIDLAAGRNFSREIPTDPREAYLLNEAAVRHLGWKDPVGKEVAWNGRKGIIVGVVKDFHYKSLHQPVEPLLITNSAWGFSNLAVKLQSSDISGALNSLEETWNTLAPDYPFEYTFYDEDFDRLYRSELRTRETFEYFSILAIIVACMGLLGLSAFATEQRIKEIGIRKVLGASVTHIVYLIARDFIKLVIIANLIAWPAAIYLLNHWLQNFAFRIDLSAGPFLLAGSIALVMAVVTVSYHAVKAALTNPVKALRYE